MPGATRTVAARVREHSVEPILLATFLAGEGFDTSEAGDAARAVLHRAGLSNPRKSAIAPDKLPRARTLLRSTLARSCALPTCARTLAAHAPAKRIVRVLPASCEHCGGVASRRAGSGVAARCAALGIRRLLVVGGSPAARRELVAALGGLEVALVEGTAKRDAKQARAEMERADIVIIWGNTALDHSVSTLYRRPPLGTTLILAPKRGAASVLQDLARHLDGREATIRAAPRELDERGRA